MKPAKPARPTTHQAVMASRWFRPHGSDAWIMGVLNCTPDSFSDGGSFQHTEKAIQHGLNMMQQGASIIDVGGESTRPGASPVSLQEELARVIPITKILAGHGHIISVDTMKAEVMRQAIAAGARLINDVSALSHDRNSLHVVADAGIDVCLMHMQGKPKSMQKKPQYENVVQHVCDFFHRRIEACLQAGINTSAILLDPGIGFGKRLEDNLALIQAIPQFKKDFGMPVLLGVSRKSFLGQLTSSPVDDREIETAVAGGIGIVYGADILRVHDVPAQRRAIQIASALSAPQIF